MTIVSTAFLDCSALPVARMPGLPVGMAQTQAWLADMEVLMAAQTPFVLVYGVIEMSAGQTEEVESRKATVLWLKAHRAPFQAYCKGMVLTCRDDLADQAPLEAMSDPLSKAYGVPVQVAISAVDALTKAQALA